MVGNQKGLILAILLTAILIVLGSRFWHGAKTLPNTKIFTVSDPTNLRIDYSAHILQNSSAVPGELQLPKGVIPIAGITSHHLPTAEGFIASFYWELATVKPEARTFLVVGPDHFERCRNLASVSGRNFLTPFGLLENNQEVTEALKNAGASEDNQCFENEHSIGVQASFIKKFFPKAKIAALVFSSAASADLAEKLANAVKEKYPETIIIASIDFSHYQRTDVANKIDSGTEKQIQNLNVKNLELRQLDSPASLRFVINFTNAMQASVKWLKHTNSFVYTGNPDNTTGYFNVIFGK